MNDFWIYLLILAGSTYLIRALPFSLMRGTVKSRFAKSFLYYIPFAVLAAMTLPEALFATGNIISAAVGLLVACAVALFSRSLSLSAALSSGAALITELLLSFFSRG